MTKSRGHSGGIPRPGPPQLKLYSLRSRPSLVSVRKFARPVDPSASVGSLVRSLPGFLAASDFREFLRLVKKARSKGAAIHFACGAHVIKVGLAPVLIDLMKRGWMTALSLNGAGIIHDFEVALCGATSEEVSAQIRNGRFGMARETGEFLNAAIKDGARKGLGLGDAVGRMVAESNFPYRRHSLLASARELNIPVTVHVAVGTDTIHAHPDADGEALGATTLRDFWRFCSLVERLDGGGVFMNIGSAVILPEVFLKAVAVARNKGVKLDDFSTAVFDFNHHYRPDQNVVRRPLGKKGKGFYFIGHHEIMIPLFAAALKSLVPCRTRGERDD
jgi:hypothetical protein